MEREGDDVLALRREVELLKALLIQEREKSNDTSQREPSSTRPVSPGKSPSSKSSPPLANSSTAKEQRSPPKLSGISSGDNSSNSTCGQRGASMRWNIASLAGQTPAQIAAEAQERSLYLQHVPVDTKRGKWWLKDRQVLSRNAPSPYDDCIAIKVRETWLWSGRTVVVDKIVTCPRPVDEPTNAAALVTDIDGSDAEKDGENKRRIRDEDEETYSRLNMTRRSQETQPTDSLSRSLVDSKQLAQETKLPPTSSAAPTDPLRDAGERMEHQMLVAAKEDAVANHQK